MAMTNYERVGKAMTLLQQGLAPYVDREVKGRITEGSPSHKSVQAFADNLKIDALTITDWDVAALLRFMWDFWNDIFRIALAHAERSFVSELRTARNEWAHQERFSTDDALRVLDTAERLLTAVSASQAEEVRELKMELQRSTWEQYTANVKHRRGGSLIEVTGDKFIKPWREVITPHKDVREGAFQQAEFAADLWQVHLGKGSDEYQNPAEFFRRTYLTDSLKTLLTRSVNRLIGKGGDPIVQLQTNFGGGKTHSMLALYHLFSGTPLRDLAGIEELSQEAGFDKLPEVKRVVLVGTKISPGNPSIKDDGTEVRTLWGELAWQLGGKKAFDRIAEDDKKATSPGDALRKLFDDFGPSMILIDEWVAYARQLHNENDLPGGSFETQFSFAQALTESARAAKQCLVVVSLPASDTAFSGYDNAADAEVGGVRGREALDRLRNVVGRMESSWRPATAEESFEIVRRRLFEPLVGDASYKERDLTARAFSDLYQSNPNEFPSECSKLDYEKRIKAAYPIHPEVFDQLYGGWSTLVKFQRTRGVLRLMATVIHNLWVDGDKAPLIMPSSIPIDNTTVRYELTRYLDDNWQPVMEMDVAGPNALPLKIDNEQNNLGKLSATRRVARTIYLGSAPTVGLEHQGIMDQRIKLGCVLPGENSSIFGDALRHLSQRATYLYHDGTRYWYATQPTVTKMARDRAQQLVAKKREVHDKIIKRLRIALMNKGSFRAVYPAPLSGEDVPDEMETRLVVLAPECVFSKGSESPAEHAAKAILESRGTAPRLFQNTLVFMAADKTRLTDLEMAICEHDAWDSIVQEKDSLNLTQQQLKQAADLLKKADDAVLQRLPECYKWVLVPTQSTAKDPVVWESHSVSGSDALAVLVSKRLISLELLANKLGGTVLRNHMDAVPLWQGNHVAIRQLVDYFARYNYLPRLSDPDVLVDAITTGVGLMTWRSESFAYAERFDEEKQRYAGLSSMRSLFIAPDNPGLLVKPEVASRQIEAEKPAELPEVSDSDDGVREQIPLELPGMTTEVDDPQTAPAPREKKVRRFHGTVTIDPERTGRDAANISEEILSHLTSQPGAKVTVTLEITAELPDGATEQLVRTVTENARTMKFDNHGFEKE